MRDPTPTLGGRTRPAARRRSALLALLPCVLLGRLPTVTWAQGSLADYERADALPRLARGTVDTSRPSIAWSADGARVWMLAGDANARRVLAIDTASGERAPAFDHEALAASLRELTGREVEASDLPIGRIASADSGDLEVLLSTAPPRVARVRGAEISIRELDPASPFALRLIPTREGRRSRSGGQSTHLTFLNATDSDLRLVWIDTSGERQSYGTLEVGDSREQHTYSGHLWRLEPADGGNAVGDLVAPRDGGWVIVDGSTEDRPSGERRRPWASRRGRESGRTPEPSDTGPPRPRVEFRDGDVYLERAGADAVRLTSDAAERASYSGPVSWSPTGDHFVCVHVQRAETREVAFVESSPRDRVQPRLHSFEYAKPGDELDVRMPRLFDATSGRSVTIDDALFPRPWSISRLHWSPDGSRLYFVYNERGHRVVRLIAVDVETGRAWTIIEESPSTFVDYANKLFVHHLDATNEVIWMSERSGWNHLWRIQRATGEIVNAITSGDWVVRSVDEVDEERGEIRFRALGIVPGQDPYFVHHARVRLDGSGLVVLTEGNGTHEIEASPDGRFLFDTWSRVDQPPVHELRRVEDGSLVCELGRADASRLVEVIGRLPEPFVAKGRDGQTDIWGVIWRPSTFDPNKKYPVIESIYAGPHGQHVPKAFAEHRFEQSLAELGFIVVKIDGMGTNWRSKAFHDVAWKNLEDAGFPDRIAWMRAAAERYPQMDLERVGIYGGSAGGQNAMRAVLDHHGFYDAAAADCGCHDNRMDKVWWNELWMSWPVDESYAESSNVEDAHRLGGALLLTVGEMDRNVDPASTMQVVDALIRADKDFELVVFPGAGHGAGGSRYGTRRLRDFFVRELWGHEPRWTESPRPTPRRQQNAGGKSGETGEASEG